MRTLLPDKLVEPTRIARQAPPEKVAFQLRAAATAGSNQIKDFKKAYHSEDMRSLFQTANTAEFPQGYDVWTVDYAKLLSAIKTAKTGSSPVAGHTTKDDPVSTVVEKFREQHADVKLDFSNTTDQLPIDLTVGSMTFLIQAGSSERRYEIVIKEDATTDTIRKSIVEYLNNNHSDDGLQALLTLLVSYENVKSTLCQKCHNLFDTSFRFPLARERIDSKDDIEPTWKPIHESCT